MDAHHNPESARRTASSGDTSPDASSRPPRSRGVAGVGPDPSAPTEVGADTPSHAGLPGWLLTEDERDEPGRSRSGRRSVLVAVAVVPWVVVALLLFRPTADTPTSPAPLAAAPSTTPHPEPPPTAAASAPAQSEPPLHTPRLTAGGGARSATTIADATAVAAILARDWLGGVGPRPGVFDDPVHPDAYVDHVAVEAVDHPGPGAVVVTLLALVLHADGDGYDRAEVVRVAVPVSVNGRGVYPAGDPWRLTDPDLALSPPRRGEIDDPTLIPEAQSALEAAGYRDVDVTRIEATDGWAFVATAEAVAPGTDVRRTHVIWLRSHGSRFVVAGDRPPETGTPRDGQPTTGEPTPADPEASDEETTP